MIRNKNILKKQRKKSLWEPVLLYLHHQTYFHNSAAIRRSPCQAVNSHKNSFQIHETLWRRRRATFSKKGNTGIRHHGELLRRTWSARPGRIPRATDPRRAAGETAAPAAERTWCADSCRGRSEIKSKQLLGRKAREFIFRFVQIHNGKPVSTIINLIFWHNVTFRIFGKPHTIRTLPSSFSDWLDLCFTRCHKHGSSRTQIKCFWWVSSLPGQHTDTIYQGLWSADSS